MSFASFSAFLMTALYAFVNAFGAWMVIRRKPKLAALFMLAAALLIIAAVAFISVVPFARPLQLVGLLLALLTSWLHARIVIGKVILRNHLFRAAVVLLIYLLSLPAPTG